eukprot:Stramenopile-MAST_4_protein_75
MSWMGTASVGIYTKGQPAAPSKVQEKHFHIKYDYNDHFDGEKLKPGIILSPIKAHKKILSLTPDQLKRRRRKKRKLNKKKSLHQTQRAFQLAKAELLQDLFAEHHANQTDEVRELMDLNWAGIQQTLKTGVHSSPVQARLIEIHKKELFLVRSATEKHQKQKEKQEARRQTFLEKSELEGSREDLDKCSEDEEIDESVYAMALEFASKKENAAKVEAVKREYEHVARIQGLQTYLEDSNMENIEERKKLAFESAQKATDELHEKHRPRSRETRQLSTESEPKATNSNQARKIVEIFPEKTIMSITESSHALEGKKLLKNVLGPAGEDVTTKETASFNILPPLANLSSKRSQEQLNEKLVASRKRTWALRQKYRPVPLDYLHLPPGYEMLPGEQYTVRAYSHCNGFENQNIEYIGKPPFRCCPTRGHPRHLYSMSYMLLEKVPIILESNNFCGTWYTPAFKWIRDFLSRDDAVSFCIQNNIEDIRI